MPLTSQVALVSETAAVPLDELLVVSAAIQKQVVRDLALHWDVSATVDAFAKLDDVPPGYWPVSIRDDIDRPSTGVHLDKDGQPFALVAADENWTVTASHEVLEMLVDPWGNRLIAGDSPIPGQGRVEFLVEVSDPSADPELGYTCNGVRVSDFYTQRYFDPIAAPGVQYSMTGAVTQPRSVCRGGYLTWHDPERDEWWRQSWFDGDGPTFAKIGKVVLGNGGIRARLDPLAEQARWAARKAGAAGEKDHPVKAGVRSASAKKADAWREAIAGLKRK